MYTGGEGKEDRSEDRFALPILDQEGIIGQRCTRSGCLEATHRGHQPSKKVGKDADEED